jgi:enoyl-[acyl-carrier protein] reductase II
MSELINMLGCRYPIIQGPIGEMNSPRLVAAICDAGAYGMLALGFSDAEKTRQLVKEVKALTDKPFGANLMLLNPHNPGILEVLAEAGVKTITTSVGNPRPVYARIHELGMKGFHVALSLVHAVRAEEAGVDGLVISGAESGGLRSTDSESTNMILIPLVVDRVHVPVVAAGGIADSRGYRAALALGAQGVQIGTRFIATEESTAHEKWKQAIVQCGDGETILIPLKRMNMRTVLTPALKKQMNEPGFDLTGRYRLEDVPKAWGTGNFDLFPAGAGQVSALIKDIKPAREIIEEMVSAGCRPQEGTAGWFFTEFLRT